MLRSLRLFLVSLFILAFLPAFAAAQRSPFAVGTASAAPGQKANGYLEVPAGADTGTNIPVAATSDYHSSVSGGRMRPRSSDWWVRSWLNGSTI